MITRHCSRCAREKSIRGVWYLTAAPATPGAFVCESCFRIAGEKRVELVS